MGTKWVQIKKDYRSTMQLAIVFKLSSGTGCGRSIRLRRTNEKIGAVTK